MTNELQAILNDLCTDDLFLEDFDGAVLATEKETYSYASARLDFNKLHIDSVYTKYDDEEGETERTWLWDELYELTDYTDSWDSLITIDYGGLYSITVKDSLTMLHCLIDLFKAKQNEQKAFIINIFSDDDICCWAEIHFNRYYELEKIQICNGRKSPIIDYYYEEV